MEKHLKDRGAKKENIRKDVDVNLKEIMHNASNNIKRKTTQH